LADVTKFGVDVLDPKGKPIPFTKVTFTLNGSAQSGAKDPLVFKVAAAGKATLVVEVKGHHTYHFDLVSKQDAAGFTIAIDLKQMIDVPRMVTLFKMTTGNPGSHTVRNQMSVALGKVREFLLISGFDYPSDHGPGGMQFHQLGTDRMHALRQSGVLDDSTVITWFDCLSGLRMRWLQGKGTEAVADKHGTPGMWKSGWSRMTVDGTKPTILDPSKSGYPGPKVNGITEIYKHIGDIGKDRPGSLEEWSIMTHAFFDGPILFDTNQAPVFQVNGDRSGERDPDDKDGRFRKDFKFTTMPFLSDFKKAFSKTPFVRIWGCLATDSFLLAIRTAANAKSDTAPLGLKAEDRTSRFTDRTVFPDTKLGIIQFFQQSMSKSNYMFALAKSINHRVEGGAPGMGALFTNPGTFGFRMFIARKNVNTKNQKTGAPEVIIGFKPEMDFLETRCGAVFTNDGYMQFNPP
jgi:hypothetical protein